MDQTFSGKAWMKSYIITDWGILSVSIPARYLLVCVSAVALMVELVLGFLPAVLALLLGYYLLWRVAAVRAKDESAIVQGKVSRLLSVQVIKWSDIGMLNLIGMTVLVTTPTRRYRFSLSASNRDSLVAFLNLKLSERLSIMGDYRVPGRLGALDKSGALKLLAIVGGVVSAVAFVTLIAYPSVYILALAAGALLLAFESSLLYGLRDPRVSLSRTYRMISYAGLLLLSVSIPAFYGDLLFFGLSNVSLVLGWIMVLAVGMAAVVIRRVVRG